MLEGRSVVPPLCRCMEGPGALTEPREIFTHSLAQPLPPGCTPGAISLLLLAPSSVGTEAIASLSHEPVATLSTGFHPPRMCGHLS